MRKLLWKNEKLVSTRTYPQEFSVSLPFAEVGEEDILALRRSTSTRLISSALLDVALHRDEIRVEEVAQLVRDQVRRPRARVTSVPRSQRIYLDVRLKGGYRELTAYKRLLRHLEVKTRLKASGYGSVACLAYWLNRHTNTNIVKYLRKGSLSKAACSDILTIASEYQINRLKGWRQDANEAAKETGKTMVSANKGARVEFEVAGELEMSDAELKSHREILAQYRASILRRDRFEKSPAEAIKLIERTIKASSSPKI
ncbi:MAG: hypothetical protein AAGM21_10135 [Pseudomonadota bacterium]